MHCCQTQILHYTHTLIRPEVPVGSSSVNSVELSSIAGLSESLERELTGCMQTEGSSTQHMTTRLAINLNLWFMELWKVHNVQYFSKMCSDQQELDPLWNHLLHFS